MVTLARLTVFLVLTLPLAGLSAGETLPEDEPAFDAELAEELGADEYGMRRYMMVYLEAGDGPELDEGEQARLQAAHLGHIRSLAESGKLILAGPFVDGESPRGILILAVEDAGEARELVEADPAVEAGRLTVSLRPWYGSAALQEVNRIHERISREQP